MRPRPLGPILIGALWALVSASASATGPACDSTLLKSLQVPRNTTLTSATLKPATATAPAYCEVRGVIGPAPSVINFAVGLPGAWNGRFLLGGDGGFDGSIALPLDRLGQGYAVANSDSGHTTPAGNDASWAYNNRTAEIDYGWRAAKETTQAAKRIVTSYYSRHIDYSYFEGCSTGGRQALVAAQRYPEEFDGIVGGAPAHDLTGLAVEQNWSLQQFFANSGKGNITGKSSLLAKAVLAKCDKADGIEDGLIADPRACSFDPGELACAAGQDPATCFTPDQVNAVRNVYRGPSNASGFSYRGKPGGSESGWAIWLLTEVLPNPAQGGFTFSFMNYLFFENDPGPSFDWKSFNFATDPQKGRFMARILNGTDPDLSDFRRNGSKFLLYHGWADGLIPPFRTIEYYEEVVRENRSRERTENFLRLFLVPGMDHCGAIGGGLKVWDRLAPLVDWVERGKAPERIVATQVDAKNVPVRTRPLCPYPSKAVWNGSGSTDDAANFRCVRSESSHRGDDDDRDRDDD